MMRRLFTGNLKGDVGELSAGYRLMSDRAFLPTPFPLTCLFSDNNT